MNKLIDFNGCRDLTNSYEGADTKLKIEYNNSIYMLKLGRKLPKTNDMQASYSASPIAEYLGCSIFSLAGITAQETILGAYNGHMAVACRDFLEDRTDKNDMMLIEFKKLESSFLGSSTVGRRTPVYENIMEIFEKHPKLEGIREIAVERYWQTFAIDALIGNFDRHAGNWGYILNKSNDKLVELAPVYDCGSSFYPQLNEDTMESLLIDRKALVERINTFPTAALMVDGKKVHYKEFLLSDKGFLCRKQLLHIYDKLSLTKIQKLISNTPGIDETKKSFYSQLMALRKQEILAPAYELAIKENR